MWRAVRWLSLFDDGGVPRDAEGIDMRARGGELGRDDGGIGDKPSNFSGRRMNQQFFRSRNMRNVAMLQYHDAVRDGQGLIAVMSDMNGGETFSFSQRDEFST